MRSFAGTYGSWRSVPVLEILQWAPPDAANCPAWEELRTASEAPSPASLSTPPARWPAPTSSPPSTRLWDPTYTNSAWHLQSSDNRGFSVCPSQLSASLPTPCRGAKFRPLPLRQWLRVSLGHCILEGRGPARKTDKAVNPFSPASQCF